MKIKDLKLLNLSLGVSASTTIRWYWVRKYPNWDNFLCLKLKKIFKSPRQDLIWSQNLSQEDSSERHMTSTLRVGEGLTMSRSVSSSLKWLKPFIGGLGESSDKIMTSSSSGDGGRFSLLMLLDIQGKWHLSLLSLAPTHSIISAASKLTWTRP